MSHIFVMKETIRNNSKDWKALKEKFNKEIKDNYLNEFEINIIVYADDSTEESDVIALQNILAMAYDVKRFCSEIKPMVSVMVEWNKDTDGIDEIDYEDEKKKIETIREAITRKTIQINQYLYIQKFIDEVKIRIGYRNLDSSSENQNLPEQTRFGRIVPVMMVDNYIESNFYYKKSMYVYTSVELIENLSKFLTTYNKNNKSSHVLGSQEYKKFVDDNMYVSQAFIDYVNGEGGKENNTLSLQKIFFLSKNDSIDVMCTKLFFANISYIMTNLKGTKERRMNNTQKEALINALTDFIKEFCIGVSVMGIYIWSCLLRYLFDEKLILLYGHNDVNDGNGAGWFLAENRLTKSLQDALTYADGVYQLIENSCLHSGGGRSYFSFRIYDVNKDVPIDKLKHVTESLIKLAGKYKGLKNLENGGKFLEITVSDSTITDERKEIGMIGRSGNKKIKHLKDLFEWDASKWGDDRFEDGSLHNQERVYKEDYIDCIIHHYGLKVFEKIVLINQGMFMVSTSDDNYIYKSYYGGSNNNKYKQEILDKSEVSFAVAGETIYKIIVPIVIEWGAVENSDKTPQNKVFDTDISNSEYNSVLISTKDMLRCYESEGIEIPKQDLVREVFKAILRQMGNLDRGTTIFCIDAYNLPYYSIDILAKGIMRYILCDGEEKYRVAVIFRNRNYINEFVRVYTAFFDKIGKNYCEDLDNTDAQIALCTIDKSGGRVALILDATDLIVARYNAGIQAYYDAEDAFEYLTLIDYLTRCKEDDKSEHKAKGMFPFDLYLNYQLNDNEETYNGERNQEGWFFNRINNSLDTMMQSSKYGCKLSDVCVQIGSKIQIDTFYNAELLFHNYGNIYRFAYIISKEILKEYEGEKDKEKKILLIAYEAYSSILIQCVAELLGKHEKCFKTDYVKWLIFSSENDEHSGKEKGVWPAFKEFLINNSKDIDNYLVYIVIPVATTLTTFYKIQNIANRLYNEQKNISSNTNHGESVGGDYDLLSFRKNIALIVVGAEQKVEKEYQGVKYGYWDEINTRSRVIKIKQDDTSLPQKSSIVKYYFAPYGKWREAIDGAAYEDKCVIGVDKTSTLPNAIFEQVGSKRKLLLENYDKKSNDSNIKEFEGCITYSHINDEEHHYQYMIDFLKYYHNIGEKRINQWFRESGLIGNIDKSAYNIIVSPLKVENAPFLKLVIDKAFEGNARVFNIQIDSCYKEDIRSKYSYIAEDYRRLKLREGIVKINVYYVDNCMVSGAMLQRGKQFIHMFFRNEGDEFESVKLYKGVILFVNSSSYETIHSILPGHEQKDFYAFVHLNVPSYNMHNGSCPACELVNTYQLMHKRSNTPQIAAEYKRLTEKHSCKSQNQYEAWLKEAIINSHSFVTWTLQWIYYSRIDNELQYIDVFGQKKSIDQQFAVIYQLIDNTDIKKGVSKFGADENIMKHEDIFVEFVKKYVISYRNYIRLKCTHDAFSVVDKIMRESADTEASKIQEVNEETKKQILTLIIGKFKDIDEMQGCLKPIKLWMKAEWFISYIKVISREQLAKYYHVREAIYEILIHLAEGFLGQDCEDSNIKTIRALFDVREDDREENSVMPEMKLKIFLLVIRRLSAMQSSFVIQNMDEIFDWYDKCKKQYEGADKYSEFYRSDGVVNICAVFKPTKLSSFC